MFTIVAASSLVYGIPNHRGANPVYWQQQQKITLSAIKELWSYNMVRVSTRITIYVILIEWYGAGARGAFSFNIDYIGYVC